METFLQSIPQVIKLKKTSDGQTFVEAVADSSTVHLQNLISKQKNTKTPKCSVKRYGKKPAPKQKSSLCPNCASSRNAFTNSTGATSSASSSWSLASEVSNEKDKKEIESLKAQLAEQKDMNIKLKSRVNQLLSASEPHLEYIDEQIIIQRMKYQIGLLQKRILLRHAVNI
nr:uncharacterized protein LOC107440821 isoform X2 [Parasteatoda tepidariorum]